MAIEGALEGIHVGADHEVVMRVWTTSAMTAHQDASGWTVVMDFRDYDRAATSKLSVTGTVSGVFNAAPALNTQIITFLVPRAIIPASVFKGDDTPIRSSFWRLDAGSYQPLRYGDVAPIRTTQSAAA